MEDDAPRTAPADLAANIAFTARLAIAGSAFFAAFWNDMQREPDSPVVMRALFATLAQESAPGEWELTDLGRRLYSLGVQTIMARAQQEEPPP